LDVEPVEDPPPDVVPVAVPDVDVLVTDPLLLALEEPDLLEVELAELLLLLEEVEHPKGKKLLPSSFFTLTQSKVHCALWEVGLS